MIAKSNYFLRRMKDKGVFDLAYYMLGDLFIKGVMFLTLPILTIFLSPTEYGKLSILATMITIFAVIFSANIENSVNNYYMRKYEDFGRFLYSNIVFSVFFQFSIFILFILFKREISDFFKVNDTDVIFVGIVCMVIFYFNLYTLYLQGAQKSREFAILTTCNKCIEISILIFLAYFLSENKSLSKVYSQIIAVLIFLPYAIYNLKKLWVPTFHWKYVKISLSFSIPLIPHVLSNTILSQSDRIMINDMLGSEQTGLYSFAYNLGISILVIISAWNSMWQPRFYKLYKDEDKEEIDRLIIYYSKIISVFAIAAILLTGPIVKLFIRSEYLGSISIIPIIIASNTLLFQYYIFVNYTFYHRKSFIISLSTAVAAAFNIGFNFIFIPLYGPMGAAYVTFFSYCLLILIHYFNAKRLSSTPIASFWLSIKWTLPVYVIAAASTCV
ncbi:lipopolysaccharide biosynthesis protein [Yersinia enterocolitica]|uniref:lipopolysaccharide biosynthesis protein n=2 Tax=Yersinia enterocolitica TaxID=630 RepID=UPI0021E98563|nr:oligosaccharide flippase family protein [Yersinia enterocolitica]EKN3338179.1 oligosaccharide flippase family protein [Yersinia enterocolitica]EKN3568098.1 oligosaccharide flippase family protein [Yersinia enterocolitica]EKN4837277.1 oligosaccharide flippase family protein [Yersinia enterocolitica]EKN4876641.1 oligosaccharide flippase family protein [Yersinia enterocolitica]EKN5088894.1 hypothetical protein [Yersinia enterocolitica]